VSPGADELRLDEVPAGVFAVFAQCVVGEAVARVVSTGGLAAQSRAGASAV
jgi:hypothetical protein